MGRTSLAVVFFGLALLPTSVKTFAADKAGDKDLPYSCVVFQLIPDDLKTAIDYCKSNDIFASGFLGEMIGEILDAEEFSEFDFTQPVRFEMCVSNDTLVQLVAFDGTKQTVIKLMDEDLSVVPGHTGLFQVVDGDPENVGSEKLYLRFENDRCYMAAGAGTGEENSFSSDIADRLIARLKREDKHNSKYQWSISSRPCDINPPMRKMFLTQLTRATAVQLQQRDDEDDLDYQLRSFLGKTRLAMLNTFAADCEYIEAGFRVDPDEGRGTMDFTIKARENSTLDRWLAKTRKARSPFAGMMQDEDQTGLALSFELGETQKESIKSLTTATVTALDLPPTHANAFSKAINDQVKRGAAHAVLRVGEVNLLAPFQTLSGGISLKNGETIAPVLSHLMTLIAKEQPGVVVGQAEDGTPAIHFWNNPFNTIGNSTLAIAANSSGIWFAVGTEEGTREDYEVSIADPEQDAERKVLRSRPAIVRSPGARERLENLIADVNQSRQSRERGFFVQSFVSESVWSSISLTSQFSQPEPETRTETYFVEIPNADGTTRTEQRVRVVSTETRGGFKKTSTAEVVDADKMDAKIQQVAATKALEKTRGRGKSARGQLRLATEFIEHGVRIHGEFENGAISGLMLFPDFLGYVYEWFIE